MSLAAETPVFRLSRVQAVLCDADGCLFPSEIPAFEASAEVTNDFLAALGIEVEFTAEELRLTSTGKNFRSTAAQLAEMHGKRVKPEYLERWVGIERERVTAHLGECLKPDEAVAEALDALARSFELALVTSSALSRIDVCLRATGLDIFFPPGARFSAEDSLPSPTSKPDPAIYLHATDRLGLPARGSVAVEDSVPGVIAAVAAGHPTIGNVAFVPPGETGERTTALEGAGAAAIIGSWRGLVELLMERPAPV
jgi:beta-phosphoglucomutase-like phosphatase (HAD superfamily)